MANILLHLPTNLLYIYLFTYLIILPIYNLPTYMFRSLDIYILKLFTFDTYVRKSQSQ
jgi:hypothetical protein